LKEPLQIIILSVIALAIAFGGGVILNFYKYEGDLYVDTYVASFTPGGVLEESYEYAVRGNYTMLYRLWDAPLLYRQNFSQPYVKALDINCSYIPYVKDYYGKVYAPSHEYEIWERAFFNEAGCYNPAGYEPGNYRVEYRYVLYPPVHYDASTYHINIKLASRHIPYQDFTIIIDNSSGTIGKIYPHPPMDVKKEGDKYILHGSSPRNALLEVEMLLNAPPPGFLERMNGVAEMVKEENEAYYMKYAVASAFSAMMRYLTFLFPLIIFGIYYVHGREKRYVVPRYLSTVPKRRKPWEVNLLFKGDATTFDMHGFYATLLDMEMRGILEMRVDGKDVEIRVKEEQEGMDFYERNVFNFIKKYSFDGVFSTAELKRYIKSMRGRSYELSKIQRDFERIRRVRDGSRFVVNGRYIILKFFALSLLIFLSSLAAFLLRGSAYPVLLDATVYSLIFSIQFAAMLPAPSTLFGRWKRDYYKEKMEWDSFKRFLLDMAHLEKYTDEDISIWKEWLVYAVALGVGKKVANRFRKLNINVPEADMLPYIYIAFASTNNTLASTTSSSSGGGGGIGAGGGFGGGGAGGR